MPPPEAGTDLRPGPTGLPATVGERGARPTGGQTPLPNLLTQAGAAVARQQRMQGVRQRRGQGGRRYRRRRCRNLRKSRQHQQQPGGHAAARHHHQAGATAAAAADDVNRPDTQEFRPKIKNNSANNQTKNPPLEAMYLYNTTI